MPAGHMLTKQPPPIPLPSLCVTVFIQVVCLNVEGKIFSGYRQLTGGHITEKNDSLLVGSHYLPLAPQGGVEPPEYHVHI